MKLKLATLYIFLFPFFLNAQLVPSSGIVEYGVEFNDQVLDRMKQVKSKAKQQGVYNYIKKMYNNHKKIYSSDITFLELYFNEDEYLLKPVDVMLPEFLKGKFIFKSHVFYADLTKKEYLRQFNRQNNKFIATMNNSYDWHITKKTKNILGYNCRKAIIEKEVSSKKFNTKNTMRIVAWFTPQIPVAFSPVKYYGLPGAILEVTTSSKHIYAKNIEFNEDVEVEKPTEGIKLSKEEYQEMISRPEEIPD